MACLVARIADARDKQAFAALFDHYAPRLVAFLERLGAEPALAEEVMQDTMTALWRKADTFDPAKSSVGTWLYRIARNRRIDLLRRNRGQMVDIDDTAPPVDDAPQPDEEASSRERQGFIRRAMTMLPPEQMALVRLAFFEERSHSEIAAATGLPLGTVKSRIRLAFGRLRRSLEADGVADAH
ncbi:sigma-70 family RNA polymerase sigma factor [Hansschlegelia quercus]|uniref:Sigma-70 family RNA polymerase sigma factor n=2 Tax=Hansschlegelia quercus TaxID=2528245 RepID=A0A4Q9GGV5_9HYPH|nr:sigma-70 family RNA polymerase sigma factor [Hansschlegelia quercus]TBN52625.1 sigma-70 family RNA polymerase sigma factor [Hansschlegelia quercus]